MSALPNGVSSTAAASPSKMPGNKSDPALKPIGAAASSPAAADPASALHSATSTSDVRAALAALHAHEDELTARLDGLRASHADLNRDLLRLDSLRAALGSQVIVTRGISNTMLASAADTAGRLSSSVRALDLEKSRVEETLRVVEQVAELKACVAGVVGSMGAPQDWEAAAGYIARASRIPDEIVRSGFANAVVPTVEIPDAPSETLEEARESLCGLFLREFEKAAKEGDGAKVTRFFKLFPLIGRGDVGLDVYGRYVCQGVAGEARAVLKENSTLAGQTRKDGFFYANALTRLFEHIARIVDAHGGLVERHYGSGKIIKVIERLQMEADVQGGIILDSWSDERAVERKITDVRSYPFSFLVQSFVSQHRGPLGTSRVNSPALGGGADKPRDSEDEGVNMKEVDGLLNEIAAMLGKWALYTRFLASKCKDPDASADAAYGIPSLITKSNLHRKVATKLIAPYESMMAFYFRRSVEKAFQLDEMPSGLSLTMSRPIDSNPPYIISAVDDVMYIVSAVIRKSLSTCQRDVVASIIPAIGRILSSDFVVMIQKKMRDEYYPKPVVRDGLPPEDKVIGFIVLNNTLDMANEYLSRIISGRLGVSPDQPTLPDISTSPLKEFFPFEQDIALVTSWLNNLNTSFQAKTTELLNDGLTALFNNVIRARLRPVLQETFRDADYSLAEDELAELAAQNFDGDEEQLLEQVPRRFEHGWDALMRPIARLATPSTFATLLDLTARHLARVLEKRVWSYGGRTSAYGAIRMERDFNGVVATVARERYGVRELFARTSQVLMVANMEEDEWEELAGESADDDDGMVWHITEEERRKARTLVRD